MEKRTGIEENEKLVITTSTGQSQTFCGELAKRMKSELDFQQRLKLNESRLKVKNIKISNSTNTPP